MLTKLPRLLNVCILVILLGFIVYGASLRNAFVLDDINLIVQNQPVHSIKNVVAFFTSSIFNAAGGSFTGIYYRPMMTTIFSVLYTLFGPNPLYFHAFQLFVHMANTILVFVLFSMLIPGLSWLSLVLALIFLVHPAQSESVLFIGALQDLLFFFFGITALLLWIPLRKKFTHYALITLLLLLSLFSKETGIVFAAIIPMYSILYRKHIVQAFSVSFVALILYGIFRIGIAHLYLGTSSIIGPIAKLPLWARVLNIPNFFLSYLTYIFFPKDIPLSFFSVIQSLNIFNLFIPFIIGVLFFVLLIFLGKMVTGTEPHYRKLYLFFFVWFVIGLGIHLQIIPLDIVVSPRWLYSPLVGFLGMVGIIIRKIHKEHSQVILTVVAICILIVLSVRTYMRTFDWRDEYTLISHDVQVNPNDYYLQNAFAIALNRANKLTEAKKHALQSIALYPNALNWNTLGTTYFKSGEIDRAITAYTTSIQYGRSVEAYLNLSGILLIYKSPQVADAFIKTSLSRFPENPELWVMLAIAQNNLGNRENALQAAKKASALQPDPISRAIYNAIVNQQPLRIPYSFE